MAIQFARVEIVGRASGGNACCKGAYNARTIVKDERTNITYNFSNRGDNVYHVMLLPDHADQKFKDIKVLMNEPERAERQKNSQLLRDIVLALPDDKELTLQDRINITHEIIEEMAWVKNGLAVQVDIHKPHDGEKNWHAHLLVTTRRFTEDGKELFNKKARDLNPEFRSSKYGNFIIPEEDIIHERGKRIINRYFERLGLENRVDLISGNPSEHIGPVRMRSVLNEAVLRNEERKVAEIEHLNNGDVVLNKVTRHMSVFSRGDLERAVKVVPDSEVRERLVEEALANKSVIALFGQDGSKTQYFTTSEIREEEKKLLRLCSYVANNRNVLSISSKIGSKDTFNRSLELIAAAKTNLSEEQYKVLSELLTSNSALSILRGRAGVGKSHVLRQIALIANELGVHVIGLSPTHKAKEAFASSGFDQADTVKGMLFKLHNGKFSLPKNSLLVVDEAGMIGNDDYMELLRVAATRKCGVILAGDERQLTSVGRGGMFEVFADKFGSSTIFDIKRQDSDWGKSVATAFSVGDVRGGISILEQENRIKWQNDATNSMQSLLSDWHKSAELVSDRLILAVKNADVAALNHGAREYLKLDGTLSGQEIAVGPNYYMKGERILIDKTSKELGLTNGDLGEILAVSKDRFVISIQNSDSSAKENSKIIEFNPSEFSAFRHGYATTVFKAQGASIKDVYVYHSGFAGLRNSYVALSRHITELKLYVNKEATNSLKSLIKQLSLTSENGSSLNYLTEAESTITKQNEEFLGNIGVVDNMLLGVYNFATRSITKFTDKYLPASEYYNYQEPDRKTESVEEVIDIIYEQNESRGFAANFEEEKLVVGGNINALISGSNNKVDDERQINGDRTTATAVDKAEAVALERSNAVVGVTNSTPSKQSAKTRFYTKADYVRSNLQREQQRSIWNSEDEKLRGEVRFKAEMIARDLLGSPNKNLSNRRDLRFGKSGKMVVRISGEKAGTWYDFSENKGGDLFALVEHKRGGNFKECAEYLRSLVGMSSSNTTNLYLAHSHETNDKYVDYHKANAEEQAIEARKIKHANNLYEKAKGIGSRSIAKAYLSEVRGIECDPGSDIRTTGILDKGLNQRLPALIAFARDSGGNITGGQQILLDSNTYNKANVLIPKKSFGKIAGSFVTINDDSKKDNGNDKAGSNNITIIAEGLETALSIKQAGIDAKILCSLGISNISNYQPKEGEKIIITADNDGGQAVTDKTIGSAKMLLESRGAYVEVVKPAKEGDFNDVLLAGGEAKVRDAFSLAVGKYKANTLNEYIEICNKLSICNASTNEIKLDRQEQEDLAYIQKYGLPEKDIVEAYRKGPGLGSMLLEQTRKSLEFAANCYQQNKDIVLEAKQWGYEVSEIDTVKAIHGSDKPEDYPAKLWDDHLSQHIDRKMDSFEALKQEAAQPKEVIDLLKQEQAFLFNLHKKVKDSKRVATNSKVYQELYAKHEKYKSLQPLAKLVDFGDKRGFKKPDELVKILKETDNLGLTYSKLVNNYQKEFMANLEQGLDAIKANKVCKYDKQEWRNQLKYFEHFTKTNMNEYAPLNKIEALKPKVIESSEISDNLGRINNQKQSAKNPIEAIEALKNEQQYLAGLYASLKYHDYYDKNLLTSIGQAHKNERENIVEQLHKLKSYIDKTEMQPSHITKTLKNSGNIHSALHNLTNDYQNYVIKSLQVYIDQIHHGKAVTMHEKTFTCQVKFLEHVLDSQKHNEFLPRDEIKQAYSQALKYQKAMSKDFGGPSL
jgi:Ti-type conjugative transfer relaxase TraA